MKKFFLIITIILTSLLMTGCYTVIWDSTEDSSEEVRQDGFTSYYEPDYFGDYYYYYDRPWWAAYEYDSYDIKNPSVSRSNQIVDRTKDGSLLRQEGSRVNPLRDTYNFGSNHVSRTKVEDKGNTSRNTTDNKNTNKRSEDKNDQEVSRNNSNNNSTPTSNNSSNSNSSLRNNNGERNNGEKRR